MAKTQKVSLEVYNDFCKGLKEGSILYNLDSTNSWGDYLLVVHKAMVKVEEIKTYTLLLIGLKKKGTSYEVRNTKVVITPDYSGPIIFLKYVGFCKFKLQPVIENIKVNTGMAAIYGSTDLHKFTQKFNIRKPQKRKYDNEGKPFIKELNN